MLMHIVGTLNCMSVPTWSLTLKNGGVGSFTPTTVEKICVFGRPGYGELQKGMKITLLDRDNRAIVSTTYGNNDEAFEVDFKPAVADVDTVRISTGFALNLNCVQIFANEYGT